jgi:uncharacterized membrane protein YgcG
MSEAERKEAAAATIEMVAAVTAKTVMAAAVMTAMEGMARMMTVVAVMEMTAAVTVKAVAMVVMTMTTADDRDGSGNGIDRGGSDINGRVGSSDREGGGGISEGTLARK